MPVNTLDLEITSLAIGGDGVGRDAKGRVIFVPWTAPGDRIRVELLEERRRFARGRYVALLEASSVRESPRCGVFGRCGGCAWQHLRYAAQLEAKAQILRDALERIGGFPQTQAVVVQPSPQQYGYRARARLWKRGGQVGFYERKSHAVCAIRDCPVLLPEVAAQIPVLAEGQEMKDGAWELQADGRGGARLTPAAGEEFSTQHTGGRELEDGNSCEIFVLGDRLRISAGVFCQPNLFLLEQLATAVLDAAGGGDCALELYAGAGLFSLGLARRFARVVAVEANPTAARDLAFNARRADLHNLKVLAARAEAAVRTALEPPQVVVLDPPRTGLAPDVLRFLARGEARRIIYLACDPATLARDSARLVAAGYRLTSAVGFDLFPQTPHVEALAVLELPCAR